MEAPASTAEPPASTLPDSSEPLSASTKTELRRRLGLATPWKKGQSGNPSGMPKNGLRRQTFAQLGSNLFREIEHYLARKSGKKLSELAESICEGAIARDAACLAFLGPRLAPILEEAARGQKVILQGIRLEVAEGKASITLASATGSKPLENTGLEQTSMLANQASSEADLQG
jgi:hypothetical protein